MKKRYLLIVSFFLGNSNKIHGFAGINLFRPFDINLLMPAWQDTWRQWTVWTENSFNVKGFDADGHSVPITQIWSEKQNSIAMLRGFAPDSPMAQFLSDELSNATETSTRGMFKVTGDISGGAIGNFVRIFLPHNMVFGVYLPIYYMKLKNVVFKDLTEELSIEDIEVKNALTSKLATVVHEFDPTLSLTGWESSGFGDLICMTEWCRDFPQKKPALKNVFLNARGGLTFPTGLKKDEDRILSIPFGYDGSMGIILGAGLILDWYTHLSGGLDFQFTHLFGNTRERRISVDPAQTEFLLLAKRKVYMDYGFIQRYNLFLSLDSFLVEGLSVRCIYQFFKHTDDTLSLASNDFSELLANEAIYLKGWTMHQLIFKLDFDPQCLVPVGSTGIKPQFSFFTKIPLNGERAIMFSTVGMTLNFNF